MTNLVKFIIGGGFTLASAGGIAFTGYQLNKSSENKKDIPKDYVQDKDVLWEYFLKGDNVDVCERNHLSVREINKSCITPWVQMVKSQKEEIGLWVYGKKESVDELLKKNWKENEKIVTTTTYKKWNSQNGISSLKELEKDKCQITDKPDDKILVVCK